MRRGALLALLALLVPAVASAQTPAAALTFEVAAIKAAEPITPQMVMTGKLHVGTTVEGTRVDIGYASIQDLILAAFKVKAFQVSGPDWMTTERFDVQAKMPEGATKDQLPEMLQALLIERFQLKFHHDARDQSIYALVVGKDGAKLKESDPDPEKPPEPPKGAMVLGNGSNQVSVQQNSGGATVTTSQGGTVKMAMSPEGQMRMEMSKVTMQGFADMLTRMVDRPVLDMTNLKGNYQVSLDVSRDSLMAIARTSGMMPGGATMGGDPTKTLEASTPSGGEIITSVQKLGLKLDPRKSPLDFVVIDHIEKTPTAN